jgi:hypothetical protein
MPHDLPARNKETCITAIKPCNTGVRIMKRLLTIFLLAALVSGCQQQIETGKPCPVVESAIRQYYAHKYPSFAELTVLVQKKNSTGVDWTRAGELHKVSPVSEIINSYPHGPYISFVERTELSEDKISFLSVNLYANEDQTCKVVVRVDERKKQDGVPFASRKPITEEDIRKMMR